MVNQDLYILAFALGISGFIACKTFKWLLYEEIGPGSAALFLGFAVAVFFGINHYDFGKKLIEQRERGRAEDVALKDINAELQKQRETTRLLAEAVREASERAHELATEADKNGRVALETVRKSQEKSEEVVSVTAWATWEILMGEFLEIEDYLKRWEEKNGLRRGWDTARSLADLAKKLDRFEAVLPEPIKTLYLERQRKYEILKKIKESSESTASRHVGTGFDLPAPAKLPAAVLMSKEPKSPGERLPQGR
jgi:hypothetical protein